MSGVCFRNFNHSFFSFKMPVTVGVLIKQSWTVGESLFFLLLVCPKSFFTSPPWIVVWYGLSLYWTLAVRSAERRAMPKTWYFVMAVIGVTIPTVFGQSSRYFFLLLSLRLELRHWDFEWQVINEHLCDLSDCAWRRLVLSRVSAKATF